MGREGGREGRKEKIKSGKFLIEVKREGDTEMKNQMKQKSGHCLELV